MQAIQQLSYGNSEVLKLTEVPVPSCAENEVLIKVKATALNDWDVALMRGNQWVIRMMYGLNRPRIHIPGVDVAGIVQQVGSKVVRFQEGDRVYGDLSESGFGAFAYYVCANEKALGPMPDSMPFTDAACLPHAGLLAWQAMQLGEIKGQVLVNGAGGGVGCLAIQLMQDYDLEVTGVDSLAKLPQLASWGYDHVIDYKQVDFTQTGKQYDVILDVITSRSPWSYARALKLGGRYVTVGGTMPRLISLLVNAPLISLIRKRNVKVLGLKPNKGLDYISNAYHEGKIKPVVDGPYALHEIPRLISYFENNEHVAKVVIEIP